MAQSIKHNIIVVNFGAQVVDDCGEKEVYYVVEFIGVHFTDQEIGELFFMLIIYILSDNHRSITQKN